jgi:Fic family protein
LKQQIEQQDALEEVQLQKLLDYSKVRYTFDSNRMEGNSLTLKETALVIEKGMCIPGKSVREHFEIVNHADAVDLLYEFVQNKSELNEYLLIQIHALVLRGIDKHNAGVYRSVNVRISGSKHEPPQPFMLNKLMEDYFLFYQEQKAKMHPLVLAAEMHERLVTIHPFVDGNGRTARLVMNLVLMQAGYPITNISSEQENRLTYYESLELAQTENNKNPFIEFVGNHLVVALEEFLRMSA